MAKPIDCPRKSDHKLKTEDGNPKFRLHANNHGKSETEDGILAKIMMEALTSYIIVEVKHNQNL